MMTVKYVGEITHMTNQQTKGNNSDQQTRYTTKTWVAYGKSIWYASKYKLYNSNSYNNSLWG